MPPDPIYSNWTLTRGHVTLSANQSAARLQSQFSAFRQKMAISNHFQTFLVTLGYQIIHFKLDSTILDTLEAILRSGMTVIAFEPNQVDSAAILS